MLDWIGKTELSSYEREIIKTSAVNAFAKRDPKAAMAMLEKMDPSARNRALPNAVQQLIKKDSAAAIEWMRNEPDSFAKFRAISESGYTLGREAPEAAIDLAKEISELKNNALSGAFSTLASQDLDTALAKAEDWKGDPQYDNIMSQIASGYARKNPEEALAWANTLEGNARSNAMSNAMSQLASNDPTLAVKHLDDLGLSADDQTYQNSFKNTASNWARQDPVSAAEWIDTLPDSNMQTNAIGDVADRWARIDPVSASEWIGVLAEGQARDQASQRLANRIQREDPEMATAWAGSIGDENTRNNALSNVYSQWIQMDAEGGRAALEASNLPEEIKQNYRQGNDQQNVPQIGRQFRGDSFGGG